MAAGARVGVAVVGCGPWGRNLVRTFARLGDLAAVADADPLVADAVAAEHGVPVVSVDAALRGEAGAAVAIAAPARHHAELARVALAHGLDTYVEKPLALAVADAEELVAQARAGDRVLMVGHLLQYHPAFVALRDLVAAGELGSIRYLSSTRLNLGRVRREENSLWSFAPHDISMILALVGEEPASVAAHGASYLSPGVADVTTTHLRFAGGQQAHVHVSWLHPYKEQRLVVVGDRAMAVFDDTLEWADKLRLYRHAVDLTGPVPTAARADAEPVPLDQAEPLELECDHFVRCVVDRATPRTDGEEGLRVLRVLARAEADLRAAGASSASATGTAAGTAAPPPGVHPTAVVDDDVAIGPGTRVWHFAHILPGSRLGRDCTIGQNVVIGPDVSVGDRCRIQGNVSLFAGVSLEDGVFCGPSAVFTNVLTPRAEVSRRDEFLPTPVRRGATIGANATIVCGHEIGAYAFVGAGAVVTADVAPHALVVGNPARRIGWVSHDGERLGPDLVCPRSGRRYEERDGHLHELAG